MTPRTIVLEPYRGVWPADDPDAGFRSLVAEYSRIDPIPTLEVLSRNKRIPVGALAGFVLARYCCSGSDALLEMGPRVIRQLGDTVRGAEAAGTAEARLAAYRTMAAMVSWLEVPLRDPGWHPGSSGRFLGAGASPEPAGGRPADREAAVRPAEGGVRDE